MSKSIKGISVEIGADVKPLNKALKDVRKESSKIGRELYKVNRGLRFSPKSTELLSQKQDLLKKRINSTKDELDALRQSQDEIEKKFKKGEIDDAQYREFERDIVQAESKLDTFNNQLEETNKQARNAKYRLDDLKKAGQTLATGMAAAGAAIAAVGTAAGVAIKQTADYAIEVDNAADAANVGVENFQNLSYALKGVGLEADDVSELLVEVNRVLGEAQEGDPRMTQALNSIGLEVQDLKDLDTYDLFIEIANGLSEMDSQAEKTAVSGVLLGEDLSRKLLPVLDDGKTSIEDLAEEAEDMGLALDEDDIEGWREFERTFRQITEQVQAIKRDMASDLLPFLQTSLLPYFENDLLPVLTNVFSVLADIVGMPFSYEGGEEIAQEIKDIETLAEAEETLAEKRERLEQNKKDIASMAMGGDNDRRQELTKEQKILEDQISLLEYRTKYWNLLDQSRDDSGGGSGGDGGDGEEVEISSGKSSYEQFIEGLEKDISDYEFEQKLSDINKNYQKEVEKLQRDKSNQLSLIDSFDISDEEAVQAKEKVKQLYNDMIADAITEGREKWKKEQEEQEEERKKQRQEELDAEKELKREILENRYEMNDLSAAEYRAYLRERLDEYDKYTDEWTRIRNKIDETMPDGGSGANDFSESLANLGAKGRETGTGYTGETEEEVKSINWMTDAFVDLGLEIEEANQKFTDWKDDLVTGLSDAIARGEDLGDVFENVADQIAAMVLEQAVVGPFVNWALGGIGLPSFHEGGFVSPRTAIQNIQRYHDGGGIGLKNDEVPAILENGEYVMNKDQVKAAGKAEQSGGTTNVFNINAIDTKSFAEYVNRNPEAIVNVVGRDIMRNGNLRKAIKKS